MSIHLINHHKGRLLELRKLYVKKRNRAARELQEIADIQKLTEAIINGISVPEEELARLAKSTVINDNQGICDLCGRINITVIDDDWKEICIDCQYDLRHGVAIRDEE